MVPEGHVAETEPRRLQWPIVSALRQIDRIEKPPTVVDERLADTRPSVERSSLDDLLRVVENPTVAQAWEVDGGRHYENPGEDRDFAGIQIPERGLRALVPRIHRFMVLAHGDCVVPAGF